MDASPPPLPRWVRQRDGRTEPFDADRINRALFAATDRVGAPDAFLARELTDSVLHFLAQEAEGGAIATEQVEETLIKVVRELGQPRIARSYAERPRPQASAKEAEPAASEALSPGPRPDRIDAWLNTGTGPVELARRCAAPALEAFCLEQVFSKNLVAAHHDGLLRLENLDLPIELASAVITAGREPGRGRAGGVLESAEQTRGHVGGVWAIDAPERVLARRGARLGEAAILVRELRWAARNLGVQVIFNLGCETAPEGTDDHDDGPLFADHRPAEDSERVRAHLDAILDLLLLQEDVQLNWHLTGRDFDEPDGRRRVQLLVRRALAGAPLTFCFDRPRRPVMLGPGLDRRHSAAVQWVGLGLPALLQRMGGTFDLGAFAGKVMSLARLAASAGVQKRDFIRRRGRPDRPPFLLDRAHVAIRLVGLTECLQTLTGPDPWSREETQRFIPDLLRRLQETLDQEARHVHLSGLVGDSWFSDHVPRERGSWKARLRLEGRFHAALGRGLAILPLDETESVDPTDWLDFLHYTWKQTSISRLCLVPAAEVRRQLTVPWRE